MYENSGEFHVEVFNPDEMCWWCHGQFEERKVYPNMPVAINLHGIKFYIVDGLKEFRFEDGDDAYVCHRCMAIFYKLAEKNCAERVALGM